MNWSGKIKGFYNKFLIYYKKCKTHILFIVIFLLLFIIFVMLRRPAKTKTMLKEDVQMLQKVKILQDRNQKDWTELKQYIIDVKTAKEINDSLAKALKKKPRFIKGRDVIITKSDTLWVKLPTTIMYNEKEKDTVYTIRKKDDYIDVEAQVGPHFGQIHFSSIDTLTRLIIIHKSLFGKTTNSVYLSNKNPYNKITEGTSFTIKEKVPLLTVGPSIGINYNGKPTVGVSVQFPIFSIKK